MSPQRDPRTRSVRALGLALATVVLLLFTTSCGSSSSGFQVKLVDLVGLVTVAGKVAASGSFVEAGQKVEVPKGGAARVAFPDGTYFLLLGHKGPTEWSVSAPAESAGVRVMLVKLGRGLLSFVVPGTVKGKGRYEIDAVSSLTVVRGTEGKVETSDTGDVVALKSGEVEVTAKSGSASVTVRAGQQLSIPAGAAAGSPRTYDFSSADEQAVFDPGSMTLRTRQ